MKTYEIFRNSDGKVVNTISAEWSEVQKALKTLPGTSARGVKPVAGKTAKTPNLPTDCYILYCDAWTSGNPGIGGYRTVDKYHNVVVERNFSDVHSNNFYELSAVGASVKFATELPKESKPVIYTDSKTALAWIREGKCNASADVETLNKAIRVIRDMLDKNPQIALQKWNTEEWGEIPADFGRK